MNLIGLVLLKEILMRIHLSWGLGNVLKCLLRLHSNGELQYTIASIFVQIKLRR